MMRAYWAAYDATLARVRTEKPATFAAVKAILDSFEPPSSGDAFFPGGADDTLADALYDVGWHVEHIEADYFYVATNLVTRERLTYIEGDVYEGRRR